MKTRVRWFAWIGVMALILAACSDGGTDDTTAETSATTEAPTDDTTATTEAMTDDTTATTAAGGEVAFDVGVTEDTITVGLLADQTGIFAPLVNDIVAAQEVYWDIVNGAGGIDGRTVELLTVDTAYDVDQHRTQYEAIRDDVVMLSQSTGSPHTSGIIDLMIEDDMVTIPLTWYSGWADPSFDQNTVLEQQTNYCLEGMNVVEYLSTKFQEENGADPTWAVVSFPGEYGQDGAFGAKYAIEQLGLTLAYDGEGLVTPTPDDPETEVITGLVEANADFVFATVNPTNLAVIMGGAAQAGFAGQWTGSVPSYDFRLLDSPVGPIIDAAYIQSGYNAAWGSDVDGMQELVDAMLAARPDLRPSDAFVIGWLEAKTTEAILRQASANGDLTRAGVKAAALSLEGIDFGGLAPSQSYAPADDPNSFVTRGIYIFDPSLEAYTTAGGATQTIGSAPEGGTTGSALLEQNYVGDLAANYDFTARCFAG